ncbi:hypothetical protein DACRYDRAFT_20056 [Dacryopinax primogenitus]|uniref:Cytoplasmic protein n=1 Tax=Dacryopinax primogenitus (strain DJM 731) TaxID=1858805 RepID=M5GB50_DACPD|nr:uncharacterized protein DACRYDRAFT_20056 [Dacryopinax primogenitus]EJU05620.1 hypothetical protein DACRYDRAFT_20056 [Dacryopinax primogenitus]
MTDTTTDGISDVLTNLAVPKTSATLTVRVIKSFEFRTEKSLVLRDYNLETETVGSLKERVIHDIHTLPGWKPYRTAQPDTLKLYTKAHGAKTTNLIINLDHDEWLLTDDSVTLASCGLENESEVSFFNRELYEQFKSHPETKW